MSAVGFPSNTIARKVLLTEQWHTLAILYFSAYTGDEVRANPLFQRTIRQQFVNRRDNPHAEPITARRGATTRLRINQRASVSTDAPVGSVRVAIKSPVRTRRTLHFSTFRGLEWH